MSDYPVGASPACPLFDYGATAAAAKAAAHDAAVPKLSARKAAAIEALRLAGPLGFTRHEMAAVLELPLQTVCPIALAILRDGTAVEDGRRRATDSGSMAAVLVLVGGESK